jgi:hypothetical protein
MSTVGQLVDRVLNTWLEGTYRAQYNVLDVPGGGNLTANATDIVAKNPLAEIGKGSFIAIGDELMLVVDRTTTNNTMTVIRGMRGTTAEVHAPGDLIEVNPRFTRHAIRDAIRREIISLPRTLYSVSFVDVTLPSNQTRTNAMQVFCDANGVTLYGPISVQRESLNTADDRRRPTSGWTFDRIPGVLQLNEPIGQTSILHIAFASSFKIPNPAIAFADTRDLITEMFLDESMEEILEVGAAARLLTGRQVPRLFPEAQGQSGAAAEVSEVGMARLGASYFKLRDEWIARESARLQRDWGFAGTGSF